jgi:hypothetical protein
VVPVLNVSVGRTLAFLIFRAAVLVATWGSKGTNSADSGGAR